MSEKEKMLSGQLYDANYDKELIDERMHCKCLCHKYNNLSPDNVEERKSVLKRFNEARFAKGANRDYMESIEFTGLMLEDLIDIGLEEMCAISDELGL